jgi:hypothetical protein
MFNLLNIRAKLRKYSPQVCKFLDIVTGIFHAGTAAGRRCSYVFEQLGFRNSTGAAIGLPIALPLRPALMHLRKGKG